MPFKCPTVLHGIGQTKGFIIAKNLIKPEVCDLGERRSVYCMGELGNILFKYIS